uniref:Virulence factor MVIN n=1 Tax=Solanum tuberosum TaxID=4113 RepID=M1AY97_SOLTU
MLDFYFSTQWASGLQISPISIALAQDLYRQNSSLLFLAPRQLQRKLAPSILPPEMYSTARQTTLVDYNQRHSPSTTSKSSLQLIHSRRIVSVSLFAKNHHLPNRCRRIRTISGRHLSSHSSESSSDYENPLSCDSTHNDFVLPPGVNGPIHITMTTTLRLVAISVSATFLIAKAEFRVKLPEDRQKKLFKHANTIMIVVGGLLAALVLIYSESIIHIYAPGLWTSAEGQTTSRIAIQQLFSILVPAIFNSGLAQIASFTDLCFASHFAGAAAGLSWHWFFHPFYCIGALLYPFPFPVFLLVLLCGCPNSHFIIDIVKISDAFLLVMAPLGLLSSIVILPLLPTFSGLIKTESWPTLIEKINRGVLLCMVVLLPIISVMSSLADPIIHVLFERYAFDSSASALVSSLYLFYSLGSPFLIVRELVVAVFYAFGDGLRPFLVSIGAIALNAILDWFFVHRLHIGVQGLINIFWQCSLPLPDFAALADESTTVPCLLLVLPLLKMDTSTTRIRRFVRINL